MQLAPNTSKNATGKAREKMPPVLSAGKTCNRCQAHQRSASGAKRGKNMQLVPNAGKTCNRCQTHQRNATGAKDEKKNATGAKRVKQDVAGNSL